METSVQVENRAPRITCNLCNRKQHVVHMLQRVRFFAGGPTEAAYMPIPDGKEYGGSIQVPMLLLCDDHMESVFDTLTSNAEDIPPVLAEEADADPDQLFRFAQQTVGLCEFCASTILEGEACFRLAETSAVWAPNDYALLQDVVGEEVNGAVCLVCMEDLDGILFADPDLPRYPELLVDENGECSTCRAGRCWRNSLRPCHCHCHGTK